MLFFIESLDIYISKNKYFMFLYEYIPKFFNPYTAYFMKYINV
jgi:hypothetical protein